ncbi:hypothetical protein [Paraburkholderia youngii]|uniref:hypothetical protein n=1 Tax=Paraburkholderia youngii TaxID=2782701 RepID=UPI003D1AD0D4
MSLNDEELRAFFELAGQPHVNMPLLLAVYLRGAGKRTAAERFTGLQTMRTRDSDWYCKLINNLWDSGELPEELAVLALLSLATHVLLHHHHKEYVVDPQSDPNSKAEFVQVFKTEVRSPRMAALMEQSPAKVEALERRGQILLLGDDMAELQRWYDQKRQHDAVMSVLGRR